MLARDLDLAAMVIETKPASSRRGARLNLTFASADVASLALHLPFARVGVSSLAKDTLRLPAMTSIRRRPSRCNGRAGRRHTGFLPRGGVFRLREP